MNQFTILQTRGDVECIIDYLDGRQERTEYVNTVLNGGKSNLAKSLAGDIGSAFLYYVCKMQFGGGGTVGGVPRYVEASRNGLFGAVLIRKNTTATIDPLTPTTVVFTAILAFGDLVGQTINEMGLEMADANLYSMVTFGDITKTSSMQVTWNWKLSFI